MTNRRQFLWGFSALTLTASLAPAACFSTLRPVRTVTLDQIRFADFATQVGTKFSVTQKPAATTLKLVEAKLTPSLHPLAHLAPDANHEKFSLLFSGPKAGALTQDTYAFEHPELGRLDIFIVPAQVEGSAHAHYTAIFNRPPTNHLI